jgi:serine/threonine protein kinase/tetratricopeptide (TPR) repeat protein
MTGDRKRDIEVFTEAIQLPQEERVAFLDRVGAEDKDLRQRIEKLLRSNERAGDFLEKPPTGSIIEGRAKVAAGEKPGDLVDRYKLLQQIGEGGCGVVFLAAQEEPVRRRVALKVIKPGMDTKSVIARFEAERQALALMDHPNIAHVLDAGATESGRPYFVMELVEGVKITDYCDGHSLPVRERLMLFAQVCDAVQHAHQKGIVHRDIKPSNILVKTGPDGKPAPKVIDFGIAKATTGQLLTDKTIFTAGEMLLGTPAYMSPEQAAIAHTEVDTRTDIYSLGVLLYELLTGTTPFDAHALLKAGLDEVRRVIRDEEPVRPSARLSTMTVGDIREVSQHRQAEPRALIREVRGDLDWIVMMALEKDRTRRYKTANGLSLDVQRFLADEAVSARPPSKIYRFQKLAVRNKLLFSGIGVIASLLVVSLIIVSAALSKERRSRRDAEAASVKSQEVTKFLEDMVQGVAPSAALGQDTKMLRAILDRTSENIGKMANQPAIEAELLNLMGTLYRGIGNKSRAEEMHRSALALRRKLFGSEDPRVAESLNELGLELQAQNKLSEAESVIREALAIRQRRFGRMNGATATSLNDLGAVYRDERRLAEAEALAREALGIRQRLFGETNLDVADSLRNLSIILGTQGKWAESEATARKVLAMQRDLRGPQDPWVASTLNDVAWAAGAQGKLEEAEMLQREALAIRRKVLPEENPEVAKSLQLVGDSMRKRGNLNEAYSVLSVALSIQNKLLGEDDPVSLDTLHTLGLTLGAEGHWSEAETVGRKVLALWRKRAGNESEHTLYAMSDLGLALENEHKWSEAESLYRESLDLSRKSLGAEAPHTLYLMHRLSLTFEGEGKWADAESVHREALALWCKRSGNEDVQTLYAMRNLAESLEGEEKWSEAETVHREVLALWRKRTGDMDSDIGYTLGRLCSTLEAQRKWSEAEAVLREELTSRRKRVGDQDPDTLQLMHQLGLTLERAGKWSEAETVHRDALALWQTQAGPDSAMALYALRNLAGTLEGEGKLSDAANLYREELAGWHKRAGGEDQQTFYSRRKLGLTLEAERKWPEAESVFRESLALARKQAGNEDPEAVADLERLVRVLMAQQKFAEAEDLLGEVLTPAFVRQPSAASLLIQRVELRGRQKRWPEAANDAALALELQPTDHYRYHMLAGLLAITHDRPAYEHLCSRILTRFTNTMNCFVAERMAQDCLLLPQSGVDLGMVDKLADIAVTVGSSNSSLAYFQGCKALSDYRLGHFREAVEWAEKAAKSPATEAQAKAFAVLAMADWGLGQKDLARTVLAKGDTLAPHTSPQPGPEDLGASWVAWLMARISLDEATALVAAGSSAEGNSIAERGTPPPAAAPKQNAR